MYPNEKPYTMFTELINEDNVLEVLEEECLRRILAKYFSPEVSRQLKNVMRRIQRKDLSPDNYSLTIDKEERKRQAKQPLYLVRI
jgi:hypothetical protein